jgi:hypothetical protein
MGTVLFEHEEKEITEELTRWILSSKPALLVSHGLVPE